MRTEGNACAERESSRVEKKSSARERLVFEVLRLGRLSVGKCTINLLQIPDYFCQLRGKVERRAEREF